MIGFTLATHQIYNEIATTFGSNFIRDVARGPWKLIYYEAYLERSDALGRENI